MQRTVSTLLTLLIIALFTSMAAMELFSWSLFLTALVFFVVSTKNNGFQSTFSRLHLGPDYIIWGFWAIMALGAFIPVDDPAVTKDILSSTRWILLLYAYAFLFKTFMTPRWGRYFPLILGLAVISTLYSIYQVGAGVDLMRPGRTLLIHGATYRANGFFSMPLSYAYSMGMAGFMIAGYAMVVRSRHFRYGLQLSTFAFFMASVAVIISQTRGAWIALVGATLPFSLLLGKRTFLKLTGAFTALFISLISFSSDFRDRLTSIWDLDMRSNSLRLEIWQTHWEIFKDHPIIGAGLKNNVNLMHVYYEKLGIANGMITHAHNNFLQMLSGTGILGFLFYVTLIGYFLWLSFDLWKKLPEEAYFYRSLALGGLAAQIYLHIGGLTEANFIDAEVNHMLWVIWAALVAIRYQHKNQPQSITEEPVKA